MNKHLFQQNFIYLAACVVIGASVGLGRLPGVDRLLVSSDVWALPQWIAAAILLVLCGWFTRLAGDLQRGLWAGYLQATFLAAWLTVGTVPALGIVCAGSMGAMLWRYGQSSRKWRTQRVLRETAGRICIGGGGVLLASSLYAWLSIPAPLLTIEEPRLWGVLVAVASVQFIAMRGIGTLITGQSLAAQRKRLSPLLEAGLGLVGVALPLVFYGTGVIAFGIVAGLLVAQAQRHRHLQQTEDTLHENQHKMTVLNNLGRELSAHADLDDVLCIIYQQMQHFIDATGFFIALYNDDDERITYPLVYEHDERVDWEPRSSANGLTDTVIKRNETVLYNDIEANGSITPNRAVRAYLGVPLSIGEKRVGVMGVTHHTNPHAFDQTDLALLETIASQVSLVVRNAVLYQQTINTADKLTRINDSLREVMFNLDRQAALQAACDIALQLSEGAWTAIYLVEPHDPRQLYPAQASGYDVAALSALSRTFPPDAITVQHNALPQHAGDSVFAPLRSGKSLAGLLVICHDTPYTLHALARNLLEILTSQIVAALENGDLLGELEDYAAEQAKLVHLSRISSSNLDIERIARDVSEALEQMLNLSQVELATYVSSERLLRFYHTEPNGIHVTIHDMPRDAVPELDKMMRAKYIDDMRTFHADHAAGEYSDALCHLMRDRALASLTAVPLLLNSEANGLLLLQSDTPHTLSHSDERLLELATHQIAAQVHNARIHMLTEEALVQRLEQLSLIEQIAQQIAQARDADLIIDSVLDAAMQSTQADFCALALPNPDSDEMFDVIWKTASAWREPHHSLRLNMSAGVVGQVMNTGTSRIIPDNHQLEHYIAPPDDTGEYRSSLAVPLRKSDAIIGVLNLESKQPDFFTQEQAIFMQSLAGHTAISIANATLLEERQQQINTLTLLRALSLETVRALDQQRIERAILKTALILLEGSQSALFRVDPQTQTVRLSQGVQHTNGHIEAAEPSVPSAWLRRVIADNDIGVINDVRADDAFAAMDALTYTGVVALPIKRRGAIREVLAVFFDAAFAFGEQERTTVELVRAQAASHLENAALNEAIRTSNDRMRAILDSTRDGIILLDERGCLQDTNRAAEDLLDLRLHAHVGEEFSAIVAAQPSTSALREMVEKYTKDPQAVHEKVYKLVTDDSESADDDNSDVLYIKVLVSDVKHMNEARNGRLLILRDITEERQAENFREEFQQTIIHDLRSPLAGIVSSLSLTTDILRQDLPDSDVRDTTLTTMGISVDSAHRLMNLVDTLHDLPTITAWTIEPRITDVRLIAQQSLDTLAVSLQQADIHVRTDFPDALTECYVDENLIHRVFTNLLHNALKFTPADGELLLMMDNHAPDDFVRVLVCDTGTGIPDDMREKIFNQGVQVDGQRPRTGEKGTGLGLNLCKVVVEAHGGDIWVEPDGPLSGACFAFTLPRTPPPISDDDDSENSEA